MTIKTSREILQQQQTALLDRRQVAASRLQRFNEIKDGLESDERIERSAELIDDLNQIDDQLETVQFHLDVS